LLLFRPSPLASPRGRRRAADVHLELVPAGEAAEKPDELAFLRLVEAVLSAMLDDIQHLAGRPGAELAIVDMMGHGGLLRWAKEKHAGRCNVPGARVFRPPYPLRPVRRRAPCRNRAHRRCSGRP